MFPTRISRFQAAIAGAADLVFLPISADLQYLTGIPRDVPNFGAVMHPGDWLEGAWLTPSDGPVLALSRMSAEFGGLERLSGVEIHVLGDFDDPAVLVKQLLSRFNLPPAPRVAIGTATTGATVAALHALLPDARFLAATDYLRPLRAVKDEDEIDAMRRAGAITEAAFADVVARLRHGMLELDVVAEVDYQLRRHGALGPSFTTSLYCSGPEHPLLFGRREESWRRPLVPPVAVLFDFGAAVDGTCYDFGRTVFFGDPPAEARRIHQLVMASQAAGIAALRAGQTAASADAAARQVITDGGYGPAFRHRLGHGIGLDVHEPPFLTASDETVLQTGMMFTVEPSIMQFDTFSARVEDVVVVRPDGGEPLTRGYQHLLVVGS